MYNYKVNTKTVLGDLLTPVSAYLRVRDLYVQSALMESSDYHAAVNGHSYIGVQPIGSVSIGHGVGRLLYPDGHEETSAVEGPDSVADIINRYLRSFAVSGGEGVVGLYGYTSFNAVRYFEHIAIKDETKTENDAPDMLYILYKYMIAFDHHSGQMMLYELLGPDEASGLSKIEQALQRPLPTGHDRFSPIGEVTSTLSDDEHRANIRRGIAHCRRGDVFQIVLSRRFVQRYEGDDFKLYRTLRSVNPSPYLFYLDMGGFRIFGSSPETHCRIVDGHAYIDPIAGTTKRTGDADEDARNAAYLRNDPKENAEHVMLVDLARNDLSRNCHDVRVEKYKELQYYSHVIHLVSRVTGRLNPDADPVKTFIDTFPAGTLSGAPKVRAMQLISDYEPHNRGAYGGCVGSICFDGSLNQAITIRTFVSRNGELWLQAGGGIVAKSDPEYELQEVNNKLGALRRAIAAAGAL